MNRLMMSVVVLATSGLSVLLTWTARAEVKTWTGGKDGVVDWSANTWSPSAPEATDAALFMPSGDACFFIVTPPVSFTGTILTTNENAYTADGVSNWTQPTYVQLTVLEGSVWRVDGCGVAVVSNGFTAARVASTFKGVISVPAGQSFVAEPTLNEAIEFTGSGTLTVTTAAQFRHVSGFSGRLIRSGDALTATVPELTTLQGRTLEVEDNGTLSLGEDLLTIGATEKMAAFGGEGWSVQSKRSREVHDHYYGEFAGGTPAPSAVNDREYCLVDAPDQDTSAFYTNRLVRFSDDWGMSFDLIMTCPFPSQIQKPGWGGQGQYVNFSVMMQNCSPDNLKTVAGSTSISNGYGFAVYSYIQADKCKTFWRWNSNLHANSSYPPSVQGIDFISSARPESTTPIHVTVACVAGRLTYTFEKDGRSMTASRDFSRYLELQGRGVYVGLSASAGGDVVGKYCPWGLASIRNFSGWVRTREALPRTKNTLCSALTDANYTNLNIGVENGAVKTNFNAFCDAGARLTDNSTYDSKILRYTRGCVVSHYTLSPRGRYLFTCDVAWGLKTSSTWGGAYFGVAGGRDTEYMLSGTTRYGIGRVSVGDMEGWCFGVYMPHNTSTSGTPSGSLTLNYHTGSSGGKDSTGTIKTPVTSKDVLGGVASSRVRYQLFYDGVGKRAAMDYNRVLTSGVTGGSWSATLRSDYFDRFLNNSAGTSLKPGYWQGCDNSCIDSVVTGLTVEEISDNANPFIPSVLQIASKRLAAVSVAAPFPESDTPAATLRGITLAPEAELIVRASTLAAKLAVEEVSVSGSAAVLVENGASLKLGALTLTGEPGESRLTVTGTATAADSLKVVVPSSWCKSSTGKVTLLSGVSVDPANVTLETEDGPVPAKRATLLLENGALKADFSRGMVLVFR